MKLKNETAKKADTRILLTGVFGPFAQDDAYGSRSVNPMELYHNQVTRVQGPFSLRMFHRTFGLLMIETNIDAPCTLLEFPTLKRFIDEIREKRYDVVGISAIVPNIGKVKKMCQEIRRHLPEAVIVVGGHIANRDDLESVIDADHICKGDGIRWFRNYLGQDENGPIRHPAVISGFGTRIMGMPVTGRHTAATLIPSVGCPMGCNFCSTSALFGGKGKSITFYKTGDELFSVLCQIEEELGVDSFFVLDENFLLYRERALRLLELMEEQGKSWGFYIFSSARVLESYSMEQLVGLGVSWVWMGLEGEKSRYAKLQGVDTMDLVKKYQAHGIRVLGSTIIGLEDHTPENIESVIEYAVAHETDFHQFMLYTPLPGTPLYRHHREMKELLPEEECPPADVHGQERFNFRHRHITGNQEKEYLLGAFQRDFEVNGPSLYRITKTTLNGWKRYAKHPDRRIALRFRNDIRGFGSSYAGAVWAMIRWYKNDTHMSGKLRLLLRELYSVFGIKSRIMAPVIGLLALPLLKREAKRLSEGWTYEPPVIYERNRMAARIEKKGFGWLGRRVREIKLPAYDRARVLENCHARMSEIHKQMMDFHDTVRLRIDDITGRKALKKEQALEEVRCIRGRMESLSGSVRLELNQVHDSMSRLYRKSKEHITQIRESMEDKMHQVQCQVEDSCRLIEESFRGDDREVWEAR